MIKLDKVYDEYKETDFNIDSDNLNPTREVKTKQSQLDDLRKNVILKIAKHLDDVKNRTANLMPELQKPEVDPQMEQAGNNIPQNSLNDAMAKIKMGGPLSDIEDTLLDNVLDLAAKLKDVNPGSQVPAFKEPYSAADLLDAFVCITCDQDIIKNPLMVDEDNSNSSNSSDDNSSDASSDSNFDNAKKNIDILAGSLSNDNFNLDLATSSEKECALRELKWLVILSIIMKVVSYCCKALALVNMIIAFVTDMIQLIMNVWTNPASLTKLLNDLKDMIISIIVQIVVTLMAWIWSMLNLNCISSFTLSALKSINAAINGFNSTLEGIDKASVTLVDKTTQTIMNSVNKMIEEVLNSAKGIKELTDSVSFDDFVEDNPFDSFGSDLTGSLLTSLESTDAYQTAINVLQGVDSITVAIDAVKETIANLSDTFSGTSVAMADATSRFNKMCEKIENNADGILTNEQKAEIESRKAEMKAKKEAKEAEKLAKKAEKVNAKTDASAREMEEAYSNLSSSKTSVFNRDKKVSDAQKAFDKAQQNYLKNLNEKINLNMQND